MESILLLRNDDESTKDRERVGIQLSDRENFAERSIIPLEAEPCLGLLGTDLNDLGEFTLRLRICLIADIR